MSNKQASRITPRSEDYSRWYQDVIRQGDLAEPAEVVKGSMVIKPHGFAIWERFKGPSTICSRPPVTRMPTSLS